jgi:orotidine-5'-phosphate decarboxylase
MACKFFEMLNARWDMGARMCVGLDPDWEKIPMRYKAYKAKDYFSFEAFERFLYSIIKETAAANPLCYKPNRAFFERYGTTGTRILRDTIRVIRQLAPDVPIIFDAKYGDIGNTNNGYAHYAFETLGVDAVTVHNYLGKEAMRPFLDQKDKGIIVLCRTSNPGADEFQDLMISISGRESKQWGETPRRHICLYEYVAHKVTDEWNYNRNCALVVGATASEQLSQVRQIINDDTWLLIPGIGTQGGDLVSSVRYGVNNHKRGIIINSSSGIPFTADPGAELRRLTNDIDAILGHL